MNKKIEYFGDSALYGELIAVILKVVWFNGVLLSTDKAYIFKTDDTQKLYKMLTYHGSYYSAYRV